MSNTIPYKFDEYFPGDLKVIDMVSTYLFPGPSLKLTAFCRITHMQFLVINIFNIY